ncbi:MAG: hypothetical protein FK733_11755 [Asgard group archaeon]|nr:hypothetical protein [Asgard group archaeon]
MMPKWMENKGEELGFLEVKYKKGRDELIYIMLAFVLVIIGIPLLWIFFIHLDNLKKWFLEIMELRENSEQEKLLVIAKSGEIVKRQYAASALVDLENNEIKDIIKEKIRTTKPNQYNAGVISFYGGLLTNIDDREEREKINRKELGIEKKKELVKESELPIVLAFIIKEEPQNKTCMVSKLVLNFQIDEIVICTNCRNYGKKELLKNWLIKTKKCPICNKQSNIDEFPVVIIRKNR